MREKDVSIEKVKIKGRDRKIVNGKKGRQMVKGRELAKSKFKKSWEEVGEKLMKENGIKKENLCKISHGI